MRQAEQVSLRGALAKSSLFAGFPVDLNAFTLRRFSKGDIAPVNWDGQSALALVVSGSIRVYSGKSESAVLLSTLEPGDCLGISTIFSGGVLTTVPICAANTTLAFLTRASFLELMRACPALFERYAVLCNEKILYLTAKLDFLTTPSCRSRLVRWLLQNRDAGNTVVLPVSKEKLAETLGVSRASLFRELHLLTEEGVISVEGRVIRLLQTDFPGI